MSFNTGILVINPLIFICCAGQVWFVRVGWVCATLSLGFVPPGERDGISLGGISVGCRLCVCYSQVLIQPVDVWISCARICSSQHSKASSLLS